MHPRIASNKPRDDRTMHVEYVLKDGRRAVIAVPFDRWEAGGHAPVANALRDFIAELDEQSAARRASVP